MLQIEIKEIISEGIIDKIAIINGIESKDTHYYEFTSGDNTIKTVRIHDDKATEILTAYSYSEVGIYFSAVEFFLDVEVWDEWMSTEIICSEEYGQLYPRIRVTIDLPGWEHWNQPWSIADFATEIREQVNSVFPGKIKYWQEDEDSILNGFGIEYFSANIDIKISDDILKLESFLEVIIKNSIANLIDSIDPNSIVTYFHFPEEIKTACNQYLIYFTQFISDIGINVDTELKEELNKTLFKVTPQDGIESLEKIKEALDIYLEAATSSADSIDLSLNNDISAMQWQANIMHLQSQLLLAKSLNQAKDATIELLQLSNYQYKQLFDNKKQEESEDIIKGVVSVTKYEGSGFTINFAEILKRLKRKFGK